MRINELSYLLSLAARTTWTATQLSISGIACLTVTLTTAAGAACGACTQ